MNTPSTKKSEHIWIIGFGQFGHRAVTELHNVLGVPLRFTVIDHAPIADTLDTQENVEHICDDGPKWLTKHFTKDCDVTRIIPALPLHLSALWVRALLGENGHQVQTIPLDDKMLDKLPNPFRISEDCVAVSYADFICPPDCVEPNGICTVTRQDRPVPLYHLVNTLQLGNTVPLTLQSRQFAPGVGGFFPEDLWAFYDKVLQREHTPLLLCTACKCHGIINGLQHCRH